MNSNAVLQGNHAEMAALKFWDGNPEAPAIVFLPLDPERLLDCPDTPLLAQIGSLSKNLVLEVRSEAVGGHASKIEDAPTSAGLANAN